MGRRQRAHTFIILHVDHHHSYGFATTHDIIHNSSLLRFAEQNKVSTVPTSVRRHRRQPEAEPNLMQLRRQTQVEGPLWAASSGGTPRWADLVSSLSCCNVSRSACKPWRIRSSRLPVTSGSQIRMHTLVSQMGLDAKQRKEEIRYNRQRTQSASRGTSWRFGCAHRSKRQSTQTKCRLARTRINVGQCDLGRRRGNRHHMGAFRIPACLPGPLG